MAGFWPLGLAVLVFVGGHLGLSAEPLRGRLVALLGAKGFMTAYSVVAFAGLFGLIIGYRVAPLEVLWVAPSWAAWLPVIAMPFAVLLVVCAVSQANPSAMGRDNALTAEDPAPGILAVTRHPMMWGVALFALIHLIVNGDVASLLLFGGLVVLSVGGAYHLDARKRAQYGEAWTRFESMTSNIPLLGLATRKTHLSLKEIGWIRIAVAIGVTLALLALHPLVFGVSPFPV